MNRDLGVWTSDDCAPILIDYQRRSAMNAFEDEAVGGRSQAAHRTGIGRLSHAGAVPTTALAVVTELFRDWASPLAGPAQDVSYWYFNEIPTLTSEVGVAEAEKLAAAGRGAS